MLIYLFNDNINIYLYKHGNPILDVIFTIITYLGDTSVYLIISSIIYWCYNKKFGIKIIYLILFSGYMVILAKSFFKIPRPPDILHKVSVKSFGFPSGHALVSSSFWSFISYYTNNQNLIKISIFTILLISFSRVYLGVHHVGDVVGGIISGLIIAYVFLKIMNIDFSKYLKHIIILIPLLLAIISVLKFGISEEQVKIPLLMMGVGIGFVLEKDCLKFEDAKTNNQRIKRAFIGIGIISIIYIGFWIFLTLIPSFYFLKYILLGFALTFIVPLVIIKTERTIS